jgi:pimeloyl-ACP methyl ester carboxylesterase
MARWLKDEGKGEPIAEPAHEVEKVEDLACFPNASDRPKAFLFPPSLAAREARSLLEKLPGDKPDHAEDWESTAVYRRGQLRKQVVGEFPKLPKPTARFGKVEIHDKRQTTPILLQPEPDLPLHALLLSGEGAPAKQKACVFLHPDGRAAAAKHPLAVALLDKKWLVVAPELRATGEAQPPNDLIHDAADHNSAEHGLWIGRPLLAQWLFDVLCVLDWMGIQPGLDRRSLTVAGVGSTSLIALCAAALFDDRVAGAVLADVPVSLITEQAYGKDMRMGLLAPGLLRWGDVPQLAALIAPRRLVIAGAVTPQGKKLKREALAEAFTLTGSIYKLFKAGKKLTLSEELRAEKVAEEL